MGSCLSDSSDVKNPPDQLVNVAEDADHKSGHRLFRNTSRLIPYSDDDPIDVKIKKIHYRWRMNRKNIIKYMSMLKFDTILQLSVGNHLPPNDNETEYITIDDLLYTLYQNEIQKSIFCQYWKMEKYIASRQVIEQHLQYMFQFKQWKVDEQISYVHESDLLLFEPFDPVLNTKTLIKDHMKVGDILVVLTPRWHEPNSIKNHNKRQSTLEVDSVIKVHSFTPFSFAPVHSISNVRDSNTFQTPQKKSPFPLKLFLSKSEVPNDTPGKEHSTSPYNVIHSDIEEVSHSNHELIPIKLTDFQQYITMQATSAAVTISETELITSKAHEKLQSDNNQFAGVLDLNKRGFEMPKKHKKLTDLAEDELAETSVIHHDSKTKKYNRFYFTLCMDRTSALLKIQELVIQVNSIIDDLSFLYSVVVEASLANLSASQYIRSIKEKGEEHMLSLHKMESPSFINICGGLAKYWSDIDTQRSILKRVQSAMQFSALGSVFMYPKDYAARTKWKVGDPVMIFRQDIETWCPGKITTVYPREDEIQVKYAVIQSTKISVIPPVLPQADEDDIGEDDNDNNNNNNMDFDLKLSQTFGANLNRIPKVTLTSNVLSTQCIQGSFSDAVYSPKSYQSFEAGYPETNKGSPRQSRIDSLVISAKKYSAIDFANDTTLETIKINRYDRDFLKPMIIQRGRAGSLSYTLEHKLHKTSELLDRLTGLGNAARLNQRLQSICADVELCGMTNDEEVEIIKEMEENKDNDDNDDGTGAKKKKRCLTAKNVHPISLMFVEMDQLSSKINLDNRPIDKNPSWELDDDKNKKYDEDFIMLKVSKMLDLIGKHFNQYLSTAISQNGSEDLSSLLESRHSRTDSFLTTRISINEYGKKGNSIKSEAFRYGHNVFALLLHNTEVAKSLLISRFIQKEIVDLCAATTEFKYDKDYLTVSMSIANLHYNQDNTKIMDSYRSWYKRCSDALKTIRYEGGNGVTHADVMFGVHPSSQPSREQSVSYSNGSDKRDNRLQIGIVHHVGSAASQPAMAFQSSFDNHFDAFNNDLLHDVDDNAFNVDAPASDNAQNQSPYNIAVRLQSPTLSVEPEPTSLKELVQKQAQSPPQLLNPNDSATQNNNKKQNQTITWITGRLDRKYTFV